MDLYAIIIGELYNTYHMTFGMSNFTYGSTLLILVAMLGIVDVSAYANREKLGN